MLVLAAILSNRMQRTRSSVRHLICSASLASVNMLFTGKRTLKNIGDGPEDKIKELSDVLVKRRTAFLDRAVISTEITVFRVLDDVANISTQLKDLSSQVSKAGSSSLTAFGLPI
jgi:hypothetical protein